MADEETKTGRSRLSGSDQESIENGQHAAQTHAANQGSSNLGGNQPKPGSYGAGLGNNGSGSGPSIHSGDSPTGGIKGLMDDDKKKSKSGEDDDDPDKSGKKKNGSDDDDEKKKKAKKDNPLNKARKGSQMLAGAQVGAQMAQAAALMAWLKMMVAQLFAAIKGFFAAIVSKVVGFVTGAFHAMVGAIGTFFAVTSSVATTISVVIIVVIGATVTGTLGDLVSTVTARNDSIAAACAPSATRISQEIIDGPIVDGNAQKYENAQKIWSVMKQAGGNEVTTAAMLGNFEIESGIDPTTVETIYDEPYRMGPRKNAAANMNFDVRQWMPDYAATYPNIVRLGLGLGQWTDTGDGATGNTQLRSYAESIGKDWWSMDTQLAFIFSDPDGQKGNAIKKMTSAEYTKDATIRDATNYFLVYWEGNPGNKLEMRVQSAAKWNLELVKMDVDTAFGDSILAEANFTRGAENNLTGTRNLSDGCDGTLGEHYGKSKSDVLSQAREYLDWFSYGQDHSLGAFGDYDNPKRSAITDCSGFVWFAIHKTGKYKVPPSMGWYTLSMEQDAKGEQKWLKEIPQNEAGPGDVVIVNTGDGAGSNGHTAIMTTEWKDGATGIIQMGGRGSGGVNEDTFGTSFTSLVAVNHTLTFARPIEK